MHWVFQALIFPSSKLHATSLLYAIDNEYTMGGSDTDNNSRGIVLRYNTYSAQIIELTTSWLWAWRPNVGVIYLTNVYTYSIHMICIVLHVLHPPNNYVSNALNIELRTSTRRCVIYIFCIILQAFIFGKLSAVYFLRLKYSVSYSLVSWKDIDAIHIIQHYCT